MDGGLGIFCSNLVSSYFTNDTSVTTLKLQNGIVSYYGIDRAIEIYEQVLSAGGSYAANNATVAGHSYKTGLGRRPDSGTMTTDEYAWLYQTCTEAGMCNMNLLSRINVTYLDHYLLKSETGYFQDSNSSSPNNIIPGFLDVPTCIQENCVVNFGNRTAGGPDVSIINNKYHGWHMSTTNVLFVNGEYDPWRALSVASDIDPAIPGNTMTTIIPAAGKALPAGTVFGFIIKNGLHASDLTYNLSAAQSNTSLPGSVDESANEAHELFATALSSWLPSYTKFAVANESIINTSLYTTSYTPTATGTLASTSTSTSSAKSDATREKIVMVAWVLTILALGMVFWA